MGRMNISIQNADTQLKLDEQKATLDEVQSDIDRLSEMLEREKAKVHSRNRAGRKNLDKAISALAINLYVGCLWDYICICTGHSHPSRGLVAAIRKPDQQGQDNLVSPKSNWVQWTTQRHVA